VKFRSVSFPSSTQLQYIVVPACLVKLTEVSSAAYHSPVQQRVTVLACLVKLTEVSSVTYHSPVQQRVTVNRGTSVFGKTDRGKFRYVSFFPPHFDKTFPAPNTVSTKDNTRADMTSMRVRPDGRIYFGGWNGSNAMSSSGLKHLPSLRKNSDFKL
jgi:hypothetical protein